MDNEDYEKTTKGKTLDEIVHEGRKKTLEMLESQGAAAVASRMEEESRWSSK